MLLVSIDDVINSNSVQIVFQKGETMNYLSTYNAQGGLILT